MLRRLAVLLKGRNWPWFPLYSCCFVLLGIMAVHFHEERIYGSDASSYLFGVVNNEWFYTERGRIIIYLSQWLPLLAVWLGLSMKAVLIAHSLGHVLFFYVIFLIGHLYFKLRHTGPMVLGIQLIGVAFTYFAWPYGEVQYGVALVFVATWLIRSPDPANPYMFGFWAMVLSFFIVGSHPLVWLVAAFSIICAFMNPWNRRRSLVLGCAVVVSLLLKLALSPSYDGQLAAGAIELLRDREYRLEELTGLVRLKPVLFSLLAGSWLTLLILGMVGELVVSIGLCLCITLVIGLYSPLTSATEQYYMSYGGVALLSYGLVHIRTSHGGRLFRFAMDAAVAFAVIFSASELLELGHSQKARTLQFKALIDNCRLNGALNAVVKGGNFFKQKVTWANPDTFHEVILLSSQGVPVRVQVFEHMMRQLTMTAHELRDLGPDAPRRMRLDHAFDEHNRELVRHGISMQQPEVFNTRLLGSAEGCEEVVFLNTPLYNERADFEQLRIGPCRAFSSSGHLTLAFQLDNNGDKPLCSGLSENMSLEIVTCDRDMVIASCLSVMADVHFSASELVSIPLEQDFPCVLVRVVHRGYPISERTCDVSFER